MKALLPVAEKIAASLIARKQTIAIAESSTGGLVAATLLAVPGASAYFLGGAVVYTKSARVALLGIGESEMKGLRPATEDYSLLLARLVRVRHEIPSPTIDCGLDSTSSAKIWVTSLSAFWVSLTVAA